MVVSELRGEKIDIIPWNTEPARFVAKALSPARVREVYIDDDASEATVIVPDDQLALAIGKEGLNARLAARLTGWKVDIKSDTEFAHRGGRGRLRRRRRRGRGVHRPLRRDPLERQALPERGAAGLALLRRPGPPGAREPRRGRGEDEEPVVGRVRAGARGRRAESSPRSREAESIGRRQRRGAGRGRRRRGRAERRAGRARAARRSAEESEPAA